MSISTSERKTYQHLHNYPARKILVAMSFCTSIWTENISHFSAFFPFSKNISCKKSKQINKSPLDLPSRTLSFAVEEPENCVRMYITNATSLKFWLNRFTDLNILSSDFKILFFCQFWGQIRGTPIKPICIFCVVSCERSWHYLE